MDMQLLGANPSPIITAEGRSQDYSHYQHREAYDVHTYSRLTYHEVYPSIDWVVYATEKGAYLGAEWSVRIFAQGA